MLRRRLLLSLSALVLALGARPGPARGAAAGGQRMALVIGNAQYPEVPLNNPGNDARLIAKTLSELGFEVTLGVDLKRGDFVRALIEFSRRARGASEAVFYYAGHALQISGSNYLLPVDIQNLHDPVWVGQNAIDLDGPVVRALLQRDVPGVRLLFIDACRDNPYRAVAARNPALVAGLASVQGSAIIDGGVLIASSAQPNKPAEDGPPGSNSVYTAALAREMRAPGVNIEAMLKRVAAQVDRETQQQQLPMFASSLTTDFFFNPMQAGGAPAAVAIQQVAPGRSALLTVNADSGLNADSQRRPRVSVLWVYVLRSAAAFQRAGFEPLYERAEATLGQDLLAREKLNLRPGESYRLPIELSPTARAIGVLVAYREPDGEGWKALLPLATSPASAPDVPLPVRIDAGARSVSISLQG
ncbi:MAG: type VI secretion system lipoprotein TssJ [Rhizobacter sp.]|nr:type VI secretion system lipoprotein TssJ [Rhizobacter sp.]